LFYTPLVQESFDFAADDLVFIRCSLTARSGHLVECQRRKPIWQLARSLIGSQTYDWIAEPTLRRLQERWPEPRDLAAASSIAVLRTIRSVNHAEAKAVRLVAAFRWIGRERPDYDLSFLRARPVHLALAWLERLPGVGPKVAAATLNASTLRMRVFIVDSHVHRILLRFGLIGPRADPREARDQVTAAAATFDADDLLELFAQLKKLGQTLCRPFHAACADCPLALRCQKKTDLGKPALGVSGALRAPRPAGPRPRSPAPASPGCAAGRAQP
jgi:endonuclease III